MAKTSRSSKSPAPQPESNLTYVRIIRNNYRNEQKALIARAAKSRHALRRREPDIPDRANVRLAYAHDADTILHSRAYERYSEKTDMFFPLGGSASRRIIGLQYAVKIARTIARCLSLNEDLVEAISYAHGLGNAPFGKVGSDFLSRHLRSIGVGVFSQPAQAVRALDAIENDGKGLNLTLQTLDGVLAGRCDVQEPIICPVSDPKKLSWDALDANVGSCLRVHDAEKGIYPATLEGCVVRATLILARFGSALEDGIAVGLIRRDDLPEDVRTTLGENYFDIINRVVMDVIDNSHERDCIAFSEGIFTALRALSVFIAERIVNTPAVQDESKRLARILEVLYGLFLDDLDGGDESTAIYTMHVSHMPEEYRRDTPPSRIVCDFMAGVTDDFLVEQFTQRFFPRTIVSKFQKRNG
jgi:dGTPase